MAESIAQAPRTGASPRRPAWATRSCNSRRLMLSISISGRIDGLSQGMRVITHRVIARAAEIARRDYLKFDLTYDLRLSGVPRAEHYRNYLRPADSSEALRVYVRAPTYVACHRTYSCSPRVYGDDGMMRCSWGGGRSPGLCFLAPPGAWGGLWALSDPPTPRPAGAVGQNRHRGKIRSGGGSFVRCGVLF